MFVKPQQWPTPSESIAIYCVRKLVSCITHLQSCQDNSVFQGKRKLLKTPECKKYIQYSEKFQGNSVFQG